MWPLAVYYFVTISACSLEVVVEPPVKTGNMEFHLSIASAVSMTPAPAPSSATWFHSCSDNGRSSPFHVIPATLWRALQARPPPSPIRASANFASGWVRG